MDSTVGRKLLMFMDAFSGHNQIKMVEEDQEKTTFITSQGLYYYKVMPFGLKNARATYQRSVNKMFSKQIGRNMDVYMDDMFVKSKEELAHLDNLKGTFATLRQYQMKLNPNKCAFGVASRKFMGFAFSLPSVGESSNIILGVLRSSHKEQDRFRDNIIKQKFG